MSRTIVPIVIAALVAACGSSGPDPLHDYSKCGEPATLVVGNADVHDGDALALPKGLETDLVIEAKDADGDWCDPTELELAFDHPDQIEVVSSGEATVLKPLYDAIDRGGTEPTTTMHASLGGLHASWTVASVVALGGAWDVTITEYMRFPNGYPFGEVTFTKLGRRMVWEDCTISLVCEEDAVIRDGNFTVEAPDVGLMLSVPISAGRDRFEGHWSAMDGDYEGDFIAVRVE
jgi:hypothetical protein